MCKQDEQNASTQKALENANKIIRNENDLAHNRMTALLTLQGLLFAAFSYTVKTILSDGQEITLVYLFLWLLSIVGFISAIIFHDILRRAHKHVVATRFWFYCYWHKKHRDKTITDQDCPPFPSLTGGGKFDDDYDWYYNRNKFNGSYKKNLKIIIEDHDLKYSYKLKTMRKKFLVWGSLGVVRLIVASWFLIFIGLIFFGTRKDFCL